MRFPLKLAMAGMVALTVAVGCNSDRERDNDTAFSKVDEIPAQVPTEAEIKKLSKNRQQRGVVEWQKHRRKEVLKALGGIKDWKVSTEKDGKPNPDLVAAEQRGDYEKVLKTAFSHHDLELKFFIYLPHAIAGLRQSKPVPEYCDLTCEEPIEFAGIQKHLGKDVKVTEDADPAGKARKWYRDDEVSVGVVDNHATVVRIFPTAKTRGWLLIDAPH